MSRQKNRSALRKAAEEMLSENPKKTPLLPTGDVQEIIHELDVHQAELEIQNEELRHSHLELTDSRNRYEDLYDFAPVGYLTLNQEGCILEANLTAAKIFGIERSSLIHNHKFSTFVSPKDQDVWHKYRLEALECKEKKTCELDIVLADFSLLSVSLETVCTPTLHENKPRLMMAVIDVTERKKAESAISYQAFLLEQVQDAVIGADPESRITYWNKGAENMYGFIAKEALGRTTQEVLHAVYNPGEYESFLEKLKWPGTAEATVLTTHKNGNKIFSEVKTTRLTDDSGKTSGYVVVLRNITRRVLAEEALKKSEEENRLLVYYAPTAICNIDFINEKFLNINDAMCEMLGYTREELYAMNPFDLLEKKSKAKLDKRMKDISATKEVVRTSEFLVKRKDGQTRNAEIKTRFNYSNGRIISAIVIAHDITERKKMEEALRKSEEENRFLVQYAPTAIYEIDYITSRFISVNNAMCLMSGYSKEELLAMNVIDLLDEESKASFARRMQDVSAGKKISNNIEFTVKRKDGEKRIVDIKVTFKLRNEKIERAIVIAHDITERKRMEDALRESERRFRQALRNAPVSLAVQNLDLRFIWAYNQRTINPADVVGKTDTDIFRQEDAAHLVALKREVIETGKELSELLWITSNGKRVFLNLFLEPIFDNSGNVKGVGIATVDLTAVKQAEDNLRALNEDLTRFNRVAVGRELRMIELKKEVNELLKQAGQPLRYADDLNELTKKTTSPDRVFPVSPDNS
jgi:PAS domain S-box-containing protein